LTRRAKKKIYITTTAPPEAEGVSLCNNLRRVMEEEEEEQQNWERKQQRKSSVVIKIPSYQEVIESSQSKSTPPSLFNPSQSFSQAFSFIKSSEFYIPPPPPSNASSSSSSHFAQASNDTVSRYPIYPFELKPNIFILADVIKLDFCPFWWKVVFFFGKFYGVTV